MRTTEGEGAVEEEVVEEWWAAPDSAAAAAAGSTAASTAAAAAAAAVAAADEGEEGEDGKARGGSAAGSSAAAAAKKGASTRERWRARNILVSPLPGWLRGRAGGREREKEGERGVQSEKRERVERSSSCELSLSGILASFFSLGSPILPALSNISPSRQSDIFTLKN